MISLKVQEFEWDTFKIEKCKDNTCPLNLNYQPSSGDFSQFTILLQCNKYHTQYDRRRVVQMKEKNKLSYSRIYVRDTDKNDWKHCANFTEYLYHPQNYRQKECPFVSSATACIYDSYCPYYHAIQEKNDWLNDSRSAKFRTAPKEKFSQSLLDDFNNIQSSNKQLEKLYKQMIEVNNIGPKNIVSKLTSNEQIVESLPLSTVPLFNNININNTGFPIEDISKRKDTTQIDDATFQPSADLQVKQKSLDSDYTIPKSNSNNYTNNINSNDNNDNENDDESILESSSTLHEDSSRFLQYPLQNFNLNNHDGLNKAKIQQFLNNDLGDDPQALPLNHNVSRITDLSSNDDYLRYKQNFTKTRKSYVYRQGIGLYENSDIEFKNYQKLSSCKIQQNMIAALKLQEYGQYICGFLNHRGGVMYIGIRDDGMIDGISLNTKQKDWFNHYIDQVTSMIEPRVLAGELKIQYVEVAGKPPTSADSKQYIIELSIIKSRYDEIYFYENQAYVKKQASLSKMSMGEIKQDLIVKLKKQIKQESNELTKLVNNQDTSSLHQKSMYQLKHLESLLSKSIQQVHAHIQNKLHSQQQYQQQFQQQQQQQQ